MSYVSLLKNIPEILSQPTGIAAIASLGIHGAIALIVPLMPVDSKSNKESASPNTVGILELNQAVQNRLPQTPDRSQASLPAQLPQPPQVPYPGQVTAPNLNGQMTVLPPLPPTTSTPLALPPIPSTANNYRIAALPTGQPLRIVPRRNYNFDTSGLNVANRNFTPALPPSPPTFNENEIPPVASQPLPVDKLPQLNSATPPSDLVNAPTDNPPVTTADGATTPQTPQPGNGTSTVAQNRQLVAPIGETPKAGEQLALAGQSIPTGQPRSTPNIPELPSTAGEQAIARVNSYEDLRKTVEQEYPNSSEKAVIRDTISVSQQGFEGTVLGFLVVDPDGKVLDIKFQDKSVSPVLKLKARQYFTQNPPKADQQITRYPFSLQFQNNSNTAEAKPGVVTPQPLSTPTVNNTQPAPTTQPVSRPLPQLRIRGNQQPPTPAATVQPSATPTVNSSQQTPTTEPTKKPLSELLNRKNQSAPTPTATEEATPAPTVNSTQVSPAVDSGRQLIQKLREAKEKRENSHPEQ